MTTLEQMKAQWEAFLAENERFVGKGVKASASRARKALGDHVEVLEGQVTLLKLAACEHLIDELLHHPLNSIK